jgi:hypothetical protein
VLRLKAAAIARFGVTPPSRNNLSHANKERDAEFAEKLFWAVLAHLQRTSPSFVAGREGEGLLRRFRVRIHAVDSTNTQLVANCRGTRLRVAGQTPPAQGRRQDAPAARPAQLPASGSSRPACGMAVKRPPSFIRPIRVISGQQSEPRLT